MKKYIILLLAISLLGLTGFAPCAGPPPDGPNLVVKDPGVWIDFDNDIVHVVIANIGNMDAGENHTYIEINAVDALQSQKPQSQYMAATPPIAAGSQWESGPIDYVNNPDFVSPRGLDLGALTTANVVVIADAKKEVTETDETDNIWDADY